MGTPEENKALAQRFIDALSAGDVATAAQCFDPSNYWSNAHAADLATTWEEMKARRRNPAFSDVVQEQIALVADGDRVVNHSRTTGTHTGEFLGIPATGRRITVDHVEIWRIEGDKIVEQWGGTWEFARIVRELTSSQAQTEGPGRAKRSAAAGGPEVEAAMREEP
jgi:predicted ester cyclase